MSPSPEARPCHQRKSVSCSAFIMSGGTLSALTAGLLAAAASLAAKFHGCFLLSRQIHVLLRLLCGGLMLSCNALMWTFFSRALRHSSSTARTTLTTTGSSFIFSGILGRLMFGENHGPLWWTGISLTLCGLLLLHGTAQMPPVDRSSKDK
uniref:Transmembrane protein 42a n=1 Tax=Oryzias latipes TaxID=8090 RepID=A0A3P9HKA2_ORYLA